jgi:hypothetical protein
MRGLITRRHAFAGVAKIGALLGLSGLPVSAEPAHKTTDAEFIRAIQSVHPNGALAARQALAAGMRPESLWAVVMPGVVGNVEPALCFTQDGASYTFRPTGRDA